MNILEKITSYRTARGWTEYQLAEKSELPQSTISSWYRKGMQPSLGSLEKICRAFGVTPSQFLADETDLMTALTPEQKEMLDNWGKLDEKQQKILLDLMKSM